MEYEKRPVAIKGWEMYKVDTLGNVYSKSGKIMKPSINSNGYCLINFSNNGIRKTFGVHRLIAKTFIPNNDLNKCEVNHIDGNKKNNAIENLEWITPIENKRHAFNVLHRQIGSDNVHSKHIIGYDKKTKEIKYKFDCVADAGRYFGDIYDSNYRHIQNIISQIALGRNNKKTYRGCIWQYDL